MICFSFLISEDGTIFEGRGWMYTPEQPLFEYNQYEEIALNIAYIGNYTGNAVYSYILLATRRGLAFLGVNYHPIPYFYSTVVH